jgi:hypothetical protein
MNKSNYYFYFLKYKNSDSYLLIERTWFTQSGKVVAIWGTPYRYYGVEYLPGMEVRSFEAFFAGVTNTVKRYVGKKNAFKFIHNFFAKQRPELLI